MNLHFKQALATLYRGLPAVLIRAVVIAAGGFAVIIASGAALFAYRASNGSAPVAGLVLAIAVIVLGACGTVIQRLFLFRMRVAMLIQFSGRPLIPPGLRSAMQEAAVRFNGYPSWRALNVTLARAMRSLDGHGDRRPSAAAVFAGPGFLGWGCDRLIGQALLALAFSRNGINTDRSLCQALAMFAAHNSGSRRQARNWLWFSAAGFCFIFLCLALPNWIIFSSAGAPVWIGIVLAAVIAGLLHQAFIVPMALAGVSAALLDETSGKTPALDVCERLRPFFTP